MIWKLFLGIVVLLATLAIMAVVSAMGVSHESEQNREFEKQLMERGSITKEEFDAIQKRFDDNRSRATHSGSLDVRHMNAVRGTAIYFTWLPWFILPFVARMRTSADVLVISIIPFGMLFFSVFTLLEVVVFCASLSAGTLLQRIRKLESASTQTG